MNGLCKSGAVRLLVVAALCLQGGASLAAQDQRKELAERPLEELMQLEVASVYGATKFWQKTTLAPSSITIVTAEEIRRHGHRTLADVLRSVRGFYINYDRNYTYVGTRGFARPGDYNIRVLILVDGHRMNDSIYDGAYVGSDFILDMDLVDRVEVIRGPGSALYGTSAFFAVVNVITKKPEDMKGLSLSGEAGSLNTYKGRVSYGAQLSKNWDLMISGTGMNSKGNRRLYFPEFDQPSTNSGIARDADDDDHRSLYATVGNKGLRLRAALSTRGKTVPTASFSTVFNDPGTQTQDTRGFVDVEYRHTLRNGWDLFGRAYYDYYGYEGKYVYDYSGSSAPPFTTNFDSVRGEWFGFESNASRKLLEAHTVTVGMEFRQNFRQNQNNYDEFGDYLHDQRDSQVVAFYVQDSFQLVRNLHLTAGLRYDHYSKVGGTMNPRLGLVFTPGERTAIKLVYGHAFRAANPFEMYYYKPNPSLRPETIKATEVVLEQYIGKHYRLSASAYHNNINKLISLVRDPVDNRFQYVNLESVSSRGLEFELEAKWSSGFSARSSYSLQSSQDKSTGDVLTNSPRQIAKLQFTAPLIRNKLFVGYEGEYVSRRRSALGAEVAGRVLSNVTFSTDRLLNHWEISASVYNLFGKRYMDPAGSEHVQAGIPQDGRTFRFKLTYRLGDDR